MPSDHGALRGEFKEPLERALFRDQVRSAAEAVRQRCARWEGLSIPLEGREGIAEDWDDLQRTAWELLPEEFAAWEENGVAEDGEQREDAGEDRTGGSETQPARGGVPAAQPAPLPRSGPVWDLARAVPRMVLVGEPGAGTTTILRRLAWQCASALVDSDCGLGLPAFPLFISLHRCGTEPGRALEDLIERELPAGFAPDGLGRAGARWLLLLDGFSEVPADDRGRLAAALRSLSGKHPGVGVIVSSRPGGCCEQLGFPVFVLDGLADGQIREFLRRHSGKGADPGEAERFYEVLRRYPRLLQWAQNPLGLRMLTMVGLSEHGDLPGSRGKLMELFMAALLERVEGREVQRYERSTKVPLLCALAFETRSAGRVAFGLDFAARILQEAAEQSGVSLQVPLFVEECSRNGLLASSGSGDGILSFAHETYQEFFAAAEMLRRQDAELISRLIGEPFWEGALILYSGLAPNGNEFIRRIGRERLLLAARALSSQLEPSPDVVEEVTARAEDDAACRADPQRCSAGMLSLVELQRFDRLQRMLLGVEVAGKVHQSAVEQAVARMDDAALPPFLEGLEQLSGTRKWLYVGALSFALIRVEKLNAPGTGPLAFAVAVRALDVLNSTGSGMMSRVVEILRGQMERGSIDAEELFRRVMAPLIERKQGMELAAMVSVARQLGLAAYLEAGEVLRNGVLAGLRAGGRAGREAALAVLRELHSTDVRRVGKRIEESVYGLLRERDANSIGAALAVVQELGLRDRLDGGEVLHGAVWPHLLSKDPALVMAALWLLGEFGLAEHLAAAEVVEQVVWPLLRQSEASSIGAALAVIRAFDLGGHMNGDEVLLEVACPLLRTEEPVAVSAALSIVDQLGLAGRLDGGEVLDIVVWPLLRRRTATNVASALAAVRVFGLQDRVAAEPFAREVALSLLASASPDLVGSALQAISLLGVPSFAGAEAATLANRLTGLAAARSPAAGEWRRIADFARELLQELPQAMQQATAPPTAGSGLAG